MSAPGFRSLQQLSAALVLAGVGFGFLGWMHAAAQDRAGALLAGLALVLAGIWQWRCLVRTQQTVERLHAQLAMMASVAQHVNSPVVVTDNESRVVWCNEAFERDTGYPLAEIRGERSGHWLRSPQADVSTTEQLRSALRHHNSIDVELLHRYRDGQDRWVRLILTPRRDTEGQFCGYVSVLVDIDAQVRTRQAYQRALRDRDALMQTLQAYAIVAETDAQGRFIHVNQRFLDICGYTEAELIGRRFALLSSGWHPPSFWQGMWTRIERGLPWQGEICNRSRQGRLFWVQTLISPFVGENGQVEKYVAIQSDVSEHRLARIELGRSQALLTRTGQLAGVGGWHALPLAGTLHMTPECQRLLGTEGSGFRSLDDLWRAFDHGARLLVRRQLQELAEHQRAEVRLIAPVKPDSGATARWVRLMASFSDTGADQTGRTQGRIVGAVQDFTAQMLAEQRIREEQRILHSAMDAIGGAFALFDPQRKLRYFNDEYAAWMPPTQTPLQGTRHEDLLRRLARRGLFKDSHGREEEWVTEVLKAPLQRGPDRVRQMTNGRWVRFVDRVTADGYRVVFRHDVTELQEALLLADAAALSKGQFLANMSHEIRTPINAITGLLALLAGTHLDPEQAAMVGKTRTATRSLLEIINDILDFSKIEAGMMRLQEAPFGWTDLRRELEVILEGARGAKPLDVMIDFDPALPPVVRGDPVRLKQVLINLGGNAVKFTERGHVTLRCLLVARHAGQAHVRFEVEDTGIGIAPALQACIFDSFSQGESSTTRRFGGSGLGLTISQRLVGMMGGHIGVVSHPGQGSVFAFDLTLTEASEADLPAAQGGEEVQAGAQALTGLHILVVEDNALNQEVAMSLLAREGAQVTLAQNGWQAVQTLLASPDAFNVVLMDLQMPVLDGMQATERIRGELGLVGLPIIAMTANATTADRDRCLEAGMNAHIGKPFDIAEVVRVVWRFVRHAAQAVVFTEPAGDGDTAQAMCVLDDAGALRRLGGNRVLLDQLRARFEASAIGLLRQAQVRAARGEWAAAADPVHQLKGSAGVVGADELAGVCSEVEAHFRAGHGGQADDQTLAQITRLEQAVQAVVLRLPPALRADVGAAETQTASAIGIGGVDEALFLQSLAALKPLKCLFDAADMEAIDGHEQWLLKHAGARDRRFEALNRCVEQMDFQGAATECARLLTPLDAVDVLIQ